MALHILKPVQIIDTLVTKTTFFRLER